MPFITLVTIMTRSALKTSYRDYCTRDTNSQSLRRPQDFIVDLSTHRTFAFQRALRNYIDDEAISHNGTLELVKWPAIFVYDVLQLPNTLAKLLDGDPTVDIVPFMTRARLNGPAFVVQKMDYARVFGGCGAVLAGMLIFGRGEGAQKLLDCYYGCDFERSVVTVDITLKSGVKAEVDAIAWIPVVNR